MCNTAADAIAATQLIHSFPFLSIPFHFSFLFVWSLSPRGHTKTRNIETPKMLGSVSGRVFPSAAATALSFRDLAACSNVSLTDKRSSSSVPGVSAYPQQHLRIPLSQLPIALRVPRYRYEMPPFPPFVDDTHKLFAVQIHSPLHVTIGLCLPSTPLVTTVGEVEQVSNEECVETKSTDSLLLQPRAILKLAPHRGNRDAMVVHALSLFTPHRTWTVPDVYASDDVRQPLARIAKDAEEMQRRESAHIADLLLQYAIRTTAVRYGIAYLHIPMSRHAAPLTDVHRKHMAQRSYNLCTRRSVSNPHQAEKYFERHINVKYERSQFEGIQLYQR